MADESNDEMTNETPVEPVVSPPTVPAEKPKRQRASKPAVAVAVQSEDLARAGEIEEPLLVPTELPKRKFIVELKPKDKAFPPTRIDAVTPADAKEEYMKYMGIVRTEREIVVREA